MKIANIIVMEAWSKFYFLTRYVMLELGRVALVTMAWAGMSFLAAAQTHPFAGGDGSAGNPYQIITPAQLDSIRKDGSDDYLEDHFVLMNDLDFDGYEYANMERGWLPIGHDKNNNGGFHGTPFTGSFHGQGHVIRNLFMYRITGGTRDYLGLFGALGGSAEVDSLGVEAVNITGRSYVGGLVGLIDETATVQHSYVTGRVEGLRDYVGGFAGTVASTGTIEQSYATAQVFGRDNVGGLIGENMGDIVDNYALGDVIGKDIVGGLVGINEGTVSTCYAATVDVEGRANVGGLIGNDNSGTYKRNYWNTTARWPGAGHREWG